MNIAKVLETGDHQIVDVDSDNIFNFEQISFSVLERGRYHVEKHRLLLKEIKVGYNLHNNFLKFLTQVPKNTLGKAYIDTTNLDNVQIFNAKVIFVRTKYAYYMKPNEILFLSNKDNVYTRGVQIKRDQELVKKTKEKENADQS